MECSHCHFFANHDTFLWCNNSHGKVRSVSLVTVFWLCWAAQLKKDWIWRFTDKYREMFGIHFICSAVQRLQSLLGKTMLSRAVYPVCLCGHLYTSALSLRSQFSSYTCRVTRKSHHLKHNSCAITGYSF